MRIIALCLILLAVGCASAQVSNSVDTRKRDPKLMVKLLTLELAFERPSAEWEVVETREAPWIQTFQKTVKAKNADGKVEKALVEDSKVAMPRVVLQNYRTGAIIRLIVHKSEHSSLDAVAAGLHRYLLTPSESDEDEAPAVSGSDVRQVPRRRMLAFDYDGTGQGGAYNGQAAVFQIDGKSNTTYYAAYVDGPTAFRHETSADFEKFTASLAAIALPFNEIGR
jgi:hypothetical protein